MLIQACSGGKMQCVSYVQFIKKYVRYADDTTLMAESEEELKSLLKVKEGSENAGLKLNIPKTKVMVSGPIT